MLSESYEEHNKAVKAVLRANKSLTFCIWIVLPYLRYLSTEANAQVIHSGTPFHPDIDVNETQISFWLRQAFKLSLIKQ